VPSGPACRVPGLVNYVPGDDPENILHHGSHTDFHPPGDAITIRLPVDNLVS
jgi:hypothetical protein